MTETKLNEFLATALQAAKAARELILSYYNGKFDIEIKADQTPVTVADRGAEQVIRETIGNAYPEHGIFGEEYGAENKDTEYLWLVDPIDGTKSFVKRYGMFSTQIALMHRGELILGVSCAPAMNAQHRSGQYFYRQYPEPGCWQTLDGAWPNTRRYQPYPWLWRLLPLPPTGCGPTGCGH